MWQKFEKYLFFNQILWIWALLSLLYLTYLLSKRLRFTTFSITFAYKVIWTRFREMTCVKGAVAKLFYLMLFVILRLLILKNKLTDPNLDRILVFETLILL